MRIYQAGSSEMFGAASPPQSEATAFYPRSPYAVGKVAGFWFATNYREAYDMFVSNGILFNHESLRRGETFVTKDYAGRGPTKLGLQDKLYLGNLDAKRDWGFAGDYVEAMWRMLQTDAPDDYVVATGEAYSVREFLVAAFGCADLDYQDYVEFDARYLRPTEVDHLLGDPSKIKSALDWEPKVNFKELVQMMVDHDMEIARRERTLIDAGHAVPKRAEEAEAAMNGAASNAKPGDRVFVAGHRGLVGSAVVRSLEAAGYTDLLLRRSSELDLRDQQAVYDFFDAEKPDFVICAAAKVGGIITNRDYPGDFIHDNLAIQTNVIEACRRTAVGKLIYLGSSCIYPKFAPQPMTEEHLLTGPLEPTNEAYAIAKIAGLKMCEAYAQQYGMRSVTLMATNLYRPRRQLRFGEEPRHSGASA